jgi:A/G-specific adenine glycosylase
MLQQTQASRVVPAFRRFLRLFPSVKGLAAAPRGDVIRAWSGLGYNRRAVALHDAARTVRRQHRGRIPADPETLERLPGVGSYTAAAVASLGHGWPVAAVDTNVRRVVARAVLGIDAPLARPSEVWQAAQAWLDRSDPGGWNQALMDLGRDVCRPLPRCAECPLSPMCRFRRGGGPRPSSGRRQSPFEGSFRQVRGAVIRALRDRRSLSLRALIQETGHSGDRVTGVVRTLAADRLVRAGPSALAGSPGGRVRLPV